MVKAATGEIVTADELGGGDVHTKISGVSDHLAENEEEALFIARSIAKNVKINSIIAQYSSGQHRFIKN